MKLVILNNLLLLKKALTFNLYCYMTRLYFNKALCILLSTNAMILTAAAMLGPIYALFVEQWEVV